MSSRFHNGLFDTETWKLPAGAKSFVFERREQCGEQSISHLYHKDDIVCNEIILKSRRYKTGQLVVVERKELLSLEVGLIEKVIVRANDVKFVVSLFIVERTPLGYFQKKEKKAGKNLIRYCDLVDTFPLEMKGSEDFFIVLLHHHVSFAYD